MKRFSFFFVAALLVVTQFACKSPAAETPPYTPARTDYGKVNAVWKYPPGRELKSSPGLILVAADIELPAPPDYKFDLDDIDIFDAASGENFGSDPYIQRLTPTGEFVEEDDPEVKGRRDYRGIFIWQVSSTVKKVNFGYWGDMLFVTPFRVEQTGRTIPESTVSAEAVEIARSTPQYTIYRLVLHSRNWYRAHEPSGYALLSSTGAESGSLCDCDVWVETDPAMRRIDLPIQDRPYVLPHRYFLIEYWCPTGVTPDKLNLYGTQYPLPAASKLHLAASTLAALSAGTKKHLPLHELK